MINKVTNNSLIPSKFDHSNLDTLAQLSRFPKTGGLRQPDALLKRAKTKYFTNALSLKLADLKTDLMQSYYNSYHCNETLKQNGKKITGRYCNNRWCLTCNRIRTAKLINGYYGTLEKMEDKQFVTLTVPNVPAELLEETINDMATTINGIRKRFHRKTVGVKLVALRKLEVTYNKKRNDYHPHYHFIVNGYEEAQALKNFWVERYEGTSVNAQDVRPADNKSVMELFKYFTKIVTKGSLQIKQLDIIFSAMRGKRVFQSMGIKKDVSEDIEEVQSQEYAVLESSIIDWEWEGIDWVDKSTGEVLTGHTPSQVVLDILENSS